MSDADFFKAHNDRFTAALDGANSYDQVRDRMAVLGAVEEVGVEPVECAECGVWHTTSAEIDSMVSDNISCLSFCDRYCQDAYRSKHHDFE